MSETKVEIIAAKEVSAVMSHPRSCECEICQSGSPSTEQRIAALEEQLQIRDAEIHLLKESRAAAVSQEQTSRVECNGLRTELGATKKQLADAIVLELDLRNQLEKAQFENRLLNEQLLEAIKCRSEIGIKLAEAQAACAEMRQVIGHVQSFMISSMLGTVLFIDKVHHALSSTCGQGWKSPEEYAKLEASVAEKHAALAEVWDRCCEIGGQGLDTLDADKLLKALSNKAGQSLLDERDRLLAIPIYIVKEWEESKSWNVSTLLTMSREALKGQP